MNTLQYLEATHLEEIGLQYQKQGYQVVASPLSIGQPFETRALAYDLTATNGCRKLAFKVAERTKLSAQYEKIKKLGEQADEEGFDDFLLTILSQPSQTLTSIEQLDQQLRDYLVVNVPDSLAELPSKIRIDAVSQIGCDSVSMTEDGIRLFGKAVVDVELENGYLMAQEASNQQEEEPHWIVSFPLSFDVELNHHLRLKAVYAIAADTTTFYHA